MGSLSDINAYGTDHRQMEGYGLGPQDLKLYTARPPSHIGVSLASNEDTNLPTQSSLTQSKTRKRKAPTLRDTDWEPVKRRIVQLHINQNISLPDVREQVRNEFGFEATYESLNKL